MADDISIKLKLDGERDFQNALKSCNAELKNMNSEVKAVDATSKGAANTQDNLAKKVEALGKASESAKNKVDTMRQIVEKQKKAQEEAAKALETAKEKFGENSKEAEKAQAAYNNATNSVNKWETQLNRAVTEEANINNELEKNERYLDEARNSTDGLASSIDEYGKEVKDADANTKDLQETVAQTSAMEAMEKVCSALSDTLGQLGKQAYSAAKEVDVGYDTIAKKTGATGDALKDFKDIANDIYGELPEDIEDVGTAVGEVNTRFKQSGKQLEATSRVFLKFAHINDTDVNTSIDETDRILTKFKRSSQDAAKFLGMLSRRGQETGRDIGTLMSNLDSNADVLQMFGFSLEESINFLSQLEDNGVEASTALAGLKKAAANYAKEGDSMRDGIERTIDAIKNAETEEEAWAIAQETFGSRGFTNMAESIREGRINIDDLSESMESYADVVEETYEATMSGWDDLTVATNNLKVAGSELTEAFFEAASPAIQTLTDLLRGALDVFESLPDEVQTVIGVIAGVGTIALEVIPKITSFVTSMATLKIMEEVTGKSTGLTRALKSMKSGFSGLKGAAPYIGIAAAAVAGLTVALEDANRAIEESHKWTQDFKDQGQQLLDTWEKERTAAETAKEKLAELSTYEEKQAYLTGEMEKAAEQYAAAQEHYNSALNASRNEAKMTEEAEHSLFGEILFNGSPALYAAADAYETVTDKKLDYTESTYKQIEQATAEKNRQEDLNDTYEDAQRVMEETTADMHWLEQQRQELIRYAALEAASAKETADAEAAAAEASISVLGEELTAWNNLDEATQQVASNVAEAVTGMHDSITSSVDSIRNFFDEVQKQEEVSSEVMKRNFQAQIDAVKDWEENLAALARQGINEEFLQYLADMGPSAANYVAAMKEDVLAGGQETVDQWNALYQEKLDLESGINNEAQELIGAIGEMAAGGEEAFNAMAEQLNAATTEDGKYIVDGLVQGIQTAQAEAEAAAEELGSETVDSVAEGAEVNSPSKATIRTGKNIDQGLINGMDSLKSQVSAKGRAVALAAITAINSANTGTAATKTGQDIGGKLASGIMAKQAVAMAAAAALMGSVSKGLQQSSQAVYVAAVSVIQQMVSGITGTASGSQATVSSAGKSLGDSLGTGISSGSAVSSAASVAANAVSAVTNVNKDAAYWAGYAIAQGMANGINVGESLAITAAINMARNALNAAKAVLGVQSPSKKFKEIGEYVGQGFTKGITDMIKPAVKASKDLTKSALAAAKESVLKTARGSSSDYSKAIESIMTAFSNKLDAGTDKQTEKVEKQVKKYFQTYEYSLEKEQKKLQKQINAITGTDDQSKATKKELEKKLTNLKNYTTKFKKIQTQLSTQISKELGEALDKATSKVTSKLQTKVSNYAKKMQEEISAVNQQISSMQSKMSEYGDLFTTKNGIWGEEVSLTDLSSQIKTLKQYRDNLNALKGQISDSLMDEITDMSVDDALKYTKQLLAMAPEELVSYNKLYTQKLKLAKKTSKNFYADEIADIKKNYTDKMEAAFKDASSKIKTYGEKAMKGFISGMKSVTVDVDIEKQAKKIIDAFKKALKIHSPSKVFADEIGAPSAEGMMEGFDKNVNLDVAGLLRGITSNLPDAQYALSAPPVYVYLGDKELSTVLTSSVVKNINGGVRAYAAAGGRR